MLNYLVGSDVHIDKVPEPRSVSVVAELGTIASGFKQFGQHIQTFLEIRPITIQPYWNIYISMGILLCVV